MPTILPGMDDDVIKEADKVFRKQGLEIRTGTKVTSGEAHATTACRRSREGRRSRDASKATTCSSRSAGARAHRASTRQALGLNVGKRGEILVDDQMRTNLPNVFAIGDCVPGPMLAHKAEEEGVIAAEVIAGQAGAHALQVDPVRRLHLAGDRDASDSPSTR